MSWKKRTANQPIFRIPGVELFNEKHDEDKSIQALRQVFGDLMLHRLGTRTPEPIYAFSEYADWTEEIRTELVRRVPETVAILRRGVEDFTGTSILGDGVVERFETKNQYPLDDFLQIQDVCFDPFPESDGETNYKIAGYGQFMTEKVLNVQINSHLPLLVGKLFEWDKHAIADYVMKKTLAHELLHVGATNSTKGSVESDDHTIGLSILEGSSVENDQFEGTWANEALIECLLDRIFPGHLPRYARQTFILSILDERFPGTLKNLASVAYKDGIGEEQLRRVKFALFSLQEKLNTIMVPYLGVHSEDFARSLVAQLDPEAAGVDTELWNSLQVVFDAMSIRDDDIQALRVADNIVYKCISEELFERAKSSYEKQDLAYVFDNIAPRVKERKSKLTKRIAFGAAAVVLGYGPITRYASEPVCTEALDVVTEPVETVTPGSANVDGQNVGIGVPFTLPNGRVAKITEVEPTVPSFERLDCR